MNEQQQQELLIEFLGDVFNLDDTLPIDQKATKVQETLQSIDKNTQQGLFKLVQNTLSKHNINSVTIKTKNESLWRTAVGEIQTALGIKQPTMAKLGGILNYINKLNTIR